MSQMECQTNCVVLLGVSGCSKTRTIYEVFSKKIGLYFTASVAGNGGSGDVGLMATMLQQKFDTEKPSETEREIIGQQHVSALLLSRLIVLDYILSIFNSKDDMHMLPYWWLLLQIRPSVYISTSTKEDLFMKVMENLLLVDTQKLCDQLKTVTGKIYLFLLVS